jgi:hypothetical protein
MLDQRFCGVCYATSRLTKVCVIHPALKSSEGQRGLIDFLESTLKRHGYYCRLRNENLTPRIRSCTVCARRKLRCDHQQPACTRCLTQGIECFYPPSSSRPARAGPLPPTPRPVEIPIQGFAEIINGVSPPTISAESSFVFPAWDNGLDFLRLITPPLDQGTGFDVPQPPLDIISPLFAQPTYAHQALPWRPARRKE